jgi:hypothetical protein
MKGTARTSCAVRPTNAEKTCKACAVLRVITSSIAASSARFRGLESRRPNSNSKGTVAERRGNALFTLPLFVSLLLTSWLAAIINIGNKKRRHHV